MTTMVLPVPVSPVSTVRPRPNSARSPYDSYHNERDDAAISLAHSREGKQGMPSRRIFKRERCAHLWGPGSGLMAHSLDRRSCGR